MRVTFSQQTAIDSHCISWFVRVTHGFSYHSVQIPLSKKIEILNHLKALYEGYYKMDEMESISKVFTENPYQ